MKLAFFGGQTAGNSEGGFVQVYPRNSLPGRHFIFTQIYLTSFVLLLNEMVLVLVLVIESLVAIEHEREREHEQKPRIAAKQDRKCG